MLHPTMNDLRCNTMNPWLRRTASATALLGALALSAPVSAAVPVQFSQQGRLLTTQGEAVDGPVELTFRLYDAASGGALVWEQVRQVEVSNGFYTATLGGTDNPLNASVLRDGGLWLAMAVDGGDEMSPRQALNAVPYAVVAARAESVADGAVTSASIAPGAITNTSITSVDWSKIDNIPSSLGQTLGGMSCASGDTLFFDGTNWNCGAGGVDTAALDQRYAGREAGGWFVEAESAPTASLEVGGAQSDSTASAGQVRAARASDSSSGPSNRALGIIGSELGTYLASGPTLVTVRAKVINASSTAALANLRCAAQRAGTWVNLDVKPIIPSQFAASSVWKEFVLSCDFAPDDEDQRIVIDDFQPTVTDLYIDYVRATPISGAPYVTSEHIVDGTIQSVDLASASVTSAKIASGAVGSAQLATSAVTSAKIAGGAVGTAELATSAVTSAKIAGGAVGTAELANLSVTSAKIANSTVARTKLTSGGSIETYNCAWTGYVNAYDAAVNYTCPSNKVLAGERSIHSNSQEDRRFQFYCCNIRLTN